MKILNFKKRQLLFMPLIIISNSLIGITTLSSHYKTGKYTDKLFYTIIAVLLIIACAGLLYNYYLKTKKESS